jgi:hypothetical protein
MSGVPSKRNRLLYAGWIALVILAGLLWRSSFVALPTFWRKYGGDALWALVVFLGVGFLLPSRSTLRVAAIAATVSCAVEFSQLYHAPWIDAVRATRLGALTIGSVFNWPDFAAYAVGILIGVAGEKLFRRRCAKVS